MSTPFGFATTAREVVDRRTGTLDGVARYALDPDNADRLWDYSERLLAAAG